MTAYYNEIDKFAAAWLRNLIAAGHIAPGDVDERDIRDVRPDDLRGYTQCHFFAGIGVWSHGLRRAGWPDRRPVWTGSCPCQPFSVGSCAHGGAKGQADDRHLLPYFTTLIGVCRPATVFGEQVASAIKWGWLDEAFGALEAFDYACGAACFPAYSVGARHERKRLYWVADARGAGRPGYQQIERIPVRAQTQLSVDGDPLARVWRALDGGYGDLLPGDGTSVAVERLATKGYGNAIVAAQAEEFIGAYLDAEADQHLRLSGVFA